MLVHKTRTASLAALVAGAGLLGAFAHANPASATTPATFGSSASPRSMVRMRLLTTSLGSRWRMSRQEKTSAPNMLSIRAGAAGAVPLEAGGVTRRVLDEGGGGVSSGRI